MIQQDRDAYAEARRAHEHIFMKLLELRTYHQTKANIVDLTDSIYALKETCATLDDMRKEVKKLYELFERLCCMGWTMKGDYEPIRTESCTGSPDVKQTVITPKHGTPEYEKMREFFGVPDGVPFRPHWPSMLEQISKDVMDGKPLPPGCDPSKMMAQYKVTIRNKKGIADGQISDPELLRRQYSLFDKLQKADPDDRSLLAALVQEAKDLRVAQDEKNLNAPDDDPKPEGDEENPF